MKYVKPNGMVLDIHPNSIEYVRKLGWKPFKKPAKKKASKKKAKK